MFARLGEGEEGGGAFGVFGVAQARLNARTRATASSMSGWSAFPMGRLRPSHLRLLGSLRSRRVAGMALPLSRSVSRSVSLTTTSKHDPTSARSSSGSKPTQGDALRPSQAGVHERLGRWLARNDRATRTNTGSSARSRMRPRTPIGRQGRCPKGLSPLGRLVVVLLS